jgi:hypothetical protein
LKRGVSNCVQEGTNCAHSTNVITKNAIAYTFQVVCMNTWSPLHNDAKVSSQQHGLPGYLLLWDTGHNDDMIGHGCTTMIQIYCGCKG